MIEQIVKLRNQGYSFRRIANDLHSTLGKVHYQWSKYQEQQAKRVAVCSAEQETAAAFVQEDLSTDATESSFPHSIQVTQKGNRLFAQWSVDEESMMVCTRYYRRNPSTCAICLYWQEGEIERKRCVPIHKQDKEWTFVGVHEGKSYTLAWGLLFDNLFVPILQCHNSNEDTTNDVSEVWQEQVSTYTFYE
ncbi:hypothetical protein [Bacillus fonticola]|uniref:hypothetical protein n=1 Tax=Bacillus fonticola TaxID=2728853 RepID=UPI001472F50B|nr:hypothetical protein [Bacillus fonticola]